jgi:hypothetical protein
MRGRAKGNQERIIVLAHQTEMMAREKRLRSLKSYLRRAAAPTSRNDDVIEMLERMAARNCGVVITEIPHPQGAH